MVSVMLFGAGPGLNVDLARLSFQVPTLVSAPQAITVKANTAIRTTVEVRNSLLRMFLLLCGGIIPRSAFGGGYSCLWRVWAFRCRGCGGRRRGVGQLLCQE